MNPWIIEQLAALHRRDLRTEAMHYDLAREVQLTTPATRSGIGSVLKFRRRPERICTADVTASRVTPAPAR